MRLIEREIGLDVKLEENRIQIIVIEELQQRISIVQELYEQMLGQAGNWILIENEHDYELSKMAEIILEPFTLRLNSKKIKTKLYQDIKSVADDNFFSEGLEIHSGICSFLEILAEKIPYPIKYQEEWNLAELLKAYDVELVEEYDDICEKLFNYINLVNTVCGTGIFILVDIKQYLTEYQISELYKLCIYKKVNLVLIEFGMDKRKDNREDIYIYDKDCCLITY